MIKVCDQVVNVQKYPDGTPRINFNVDTILPYEYNDRPYIIVEWLYEGMDEIFTLMLIKKHLSTKLFDTDFYLYMPYIPNARMDRVKNDNEVFTLKYFCDFINWLNFTVVYVLDAHSDVSVALLNNCMHENPKEYIEDVLTNIDDDVILYFPDAGAAKRYADMFPNLMYCYGEKKRDWSNGNILGLEIRSNGVDLQEKTILMIDDIIAYGGSLFYSARELKNAGVGKIYAYATHTENSILDRENGTLIKSLEDGTVERLFTTNSLFSGDHDKITIMEV